MSGLGKGRLG
jgi:hypothetical protein